MLILIGLSLGCSAHLDFFLKTPCLVCQTCIQAFSCCSVHLRQRAERKSLFVVSTIRDFSLTGIQRIWHLVLDTCSDRYCRTASCIILPTGDRYDAWQTDDYEEVSLCTNLSVGRSTPLEKSSVWVKETHYNPACCSRV